MFAHHSGSRMLAVMLAAGTAYAGTVKPMIAGRPPERPDMPYVAPTGELRTSVPVNAAAPERAVPVFIKQVNTTPAGLNIVGDAANEPSLAVDPNDPRRIAVGWRQFDTIASSFRQAGCAYSRDAGRTWTRVGPLEPGVFRSDPVLRSSSNGTFFYYSLKVVGNSYLAGMFVSTDGGATWSAPQSIPGGDKQWFTIDTSASPSNGFHQTSWNVAGNPFAPAVYTRSITGGASFQTPTTLPGGPPIFGVQTLGPDGELYIGGTNASGPGLAAVKSLNAGNPAVTPPTFAATGTVAIAGDLTTSAAVNPVGLAGQVWVDVDHTSGPSRGWVYLLASVDPDTGPDPLETRFMRSRDGGATWDPFVRVHDDPPASNSFQWFGTMGVAPNGRIDVIYNDTSEDTVTNRLTRTRYTFSTDQGASWAPSQPLTIAWNPLVGWPQQNKIGDYYDLRSDNVGVSAIISTTVNAEQDVFFVRIGEFDCNNNGVGDSTEIALGQAKDCDSDGVPDACTRPCAGDINGDNRTNTADLAILLGLFGQTVALCDPANLNTDTAINTADLAILLGNFGCGN